MIQTGKSPSHFGYAINRIAGLYLLSMLMYVLLRLIVRDGIWILGLINSFAYILFLPLPLLLLLAILARARRAYLSLIPIIILLLLWFGPRWLPKPVETSDASALRVMSNNIWRLNPTPQDVVKLIMDTAPDVVFLQEVQLSTQGDALLPLAAEFPFQSTLVDEYRLSMYTAANITLSRYPFVTSEKIDLDLATMPHIYRDVIMVDNHHIALYNVHLITPFTEQPRLPVGDNYFAKVAFGFNDEARNQQLEHLLAYLNLEEYPYIVAGDFNLSDLSMTYAQLSEKMIDSFAEAADGLGYTWPVSKALALPTFLPPLVRMDYIWHSADLHTMRAWQGMFVGSDHLPLFADLAIAVHK